MVCAIDFFWLLGAAVSSLECDLTLLRESCIRGRGPFGTHIVVEASFVVLEKVAKTLKRRNRLVTRHKLFSAFFRGTHYFWNPTTDG